MNDIYDVVIEYTRIFESLMERVGITAKRKIPDPGGDTRDRIVVLRTRTKEMGRSFNLWIDYTCALAADVSRFSMFDYIGVSLQGLQFAATMVPARMSLATDDLEEPRAQSRKLSMRYTLWLLQSADPPFAARSTTSFHFHRDDDSYFQQQACLLVRYFFPDARNSERRSKEPKDPFMSAQISMLQGDKRLANVSRQNPTVPHRGPAGPAGSVDTGSRLDSAEARHYLNLTASTGSSIRLFTMTYPDKRKKIHTSTWYCDIDHEAALQFNDRYSFLRHMKDPASHNDRQSPIDLQLETLSRNKHKILAREDEYCYPICDCVLNTLKPVIATSDPAEIRKRLYEHIAAHIKDPAYKSVPALDNLELD
ncbi:hypothetical protein EV127DRAFT_481222 [Xylaria flabelliformis]|nr:hypothetical protein EV127DRAFT_481222 [Xylaria flabelliformis]